VESAIELLQIAVLFTLEFYIGFGETHSMPGLSNSVPSSN
jgi:hypothetical protein